MSDMPSATQYNIPTSTPQTDAVRTLADILVSLGALDPGRAKQIKLIEIQTGRPQEEIVKSQNLVTEDALAQAKAQIYNIPFMDISAIPVSPEALSVVPQETALRFKIFPISVDAATKTLVIAMADPLDLTAIGYIEQKTGYQIRPYAGSPSKIDTMVS